MFSSKFSDDFTVEDGSGPRFKAAWDKSRENLLILEDKTDNVTLVIGMGSGIGGTWIHENQEVSTCHISLSEGILCTGDHDHGLYQNRLDESRPDVLIIPTAYEFEEYTDLVKTLGDPSSTATGGFSGGDYRLGDVKELVMEFQDLVNSAKQIERDCRGSCCGILECCTTEDYFTTEDLRESLIDMWVAERCKVNKGGKIYMVPKPPTEGTASRRRLCVPKQMSEEKVPDLLLLLNRGLSSPGKTVHSVYGFSLVTVPVQKRARKPGTQTRFIVVVVGGKCTKHSAPGTDGEMGLHLMCLDQLAINMVGTADFLTALTLIRVCRKEGRLQEGMNSLDYSWFPTQSPDLDTFWLACHCLSGNRWSQAIASLQHKFYYSTHYIKPGPGDELRDWIDEIGGSKYCQTDLVGALIVCTDNLLRKFEENAGFDKSDFDRNTKHSPDPQ